MKRIWRVLLTVGWAGLLVLSGCAPEAVPEPEARPVLTVWTLQERAQALEEAAASFADAEVQWTGYAMEDYKRALSMAAATDEMPDLFFVWEAGYFTPLVRAGKMLPLTEYIQDAADLLRPGALSQLMVDGDLYAVPMERSLVVTYYNRDVFTAAELTPPETWTAFLDCCRTLADRGITPLALSQSESWHAGELLTALLAGLGGTAFFDAAAAGDWTGDALDAGLETLSAFAAQGYLDLCDNAFRTLHEGEAAMVLGGDWYIPLWEGDASLGAFLLPAQAEACRGCAIQSVEACYGISSRCQTPELAWSLLLHMMEAAQETAALPDSELRREVEALYGDVTESVLWIDRGIGGEIGAAFNQMALAVASGRDWQTERDLFLQNIT